MHVLWMLRSFEPVFFTFREALAPLLPTQTSRPKKNKAESVYELFKIFGDWLSNWGSKEENE